MCGFLGYAGAGGHSAIDAGAHWIRRRGPDSMGDWTTADGRVAIRHARLAISDISHAADQPISDAESGLTVAFVGEIYNHLALRSELGGSYRTQSDTETLLRLFRVVGVEAGLRRLRGMFTIILVDERERKVRLMRDPVGKKPFYLLSGRNGSWFGSSVLSIAAAAGAMKLDDHAASQWWQNGFCPPDQSLLKGCVPIKPGEVVELDWEGTKRSSKQISPGLPEPINDISTADATAELERLLRQATRRRLADNPNPVALLSGGIDSTVVCKMAVEAGATRLLTLRTRWMTTPDAKYAREAAQRLGVPLEMVTLGSDPVGQRVARMTQLHDEPLGMLSFIPMASLAEEAGRFSRVLLTGDGGDEVFGGYGQPADWVAKPGDSAAQDAFPCGPPLPEWMSVYGRRASSTDLVGHNFAKVDRATAEQGIEARSPMLDWDVMAFARSLPQRVFFHKNVSKPMVKALLAGWPTSFLERPKAGFTFHLRWLWALSGYQDLREGIEMESVERFQEHLPTGLRHQPTHWSLWQINQNFAEVYKLYAWSSFKRKVRNCDAGT